MKNLSNPLAGSVLVPLVLIAAAQLILTAASATDVAIQKNIFGLGVTTLIISNEEIMIS